MNQSTLDEKAYEIRLSDLVEQNPDDLFALITAQKMTKDVFMRNRYTERMVDCIRRKNNLSSYLTGAMHLMDVEKRDLQRKLLDEMVDKYPVRGRLCRVIFYLKNDSTAKA